jgi:hypothetical protein
LLRRQCCGSQIKAAVAQSVVYINHLDTPVSSSTIAPERLKSELLNWAWRR